MNLTKRVKRSSRRKHDPYVVEAKKRYARVDAWVLGFRSGYKEIRLRDDSEKQVADFLIRATRDYEASCTSYEEARQEPKVTYEEIQSIVAKGREPTDEDKKRIDDLLFEEAARRGGMNKYDAALTLDKCIDQANAYGMIHDSKNLLRQLKACQEARKDLRRDNEILSARIAQLERFSKIVTPIDKTKKRDNLGGITP